jgi:hypothetical protein
VVARPLRFALSLAVALIVGGILLVLVLFGGPSDVSAGPVVRAAASSETIIRDCAADGRLNRRYYLVDLERTLGELPADVDRYTNCREEITDAIIAQIRQGPRLRIFKLSGEILFVLPKCTSSQRRQSRAMTLAFGTRRIVLAASRCTKWLVRTGTMTSVHFVYRGRGFVGLMFARPAKPGRYAWTLRTGRTSTRGTVRVVQYGRFLVPYTTLR